MKKIGLCLGVVFVAVLAMAPGLFSAPQKLRILVVSSYHGDYLWSQDTHKGLCAAFKDFKFLDNAQQIEEYTKNDFVETPTVVIKKVWMDTKRKSEMAEKMAAAAAVMNEIKAFRPDLVFLGDDNATNFVGTKLLNTAIPAVFWGVDFDPFKYGLINTKEKPGHNITGVYQPGYYKDCLDNLKKLLPNIQTFAILADDSETGRAKSGTLAKLAQQNLVPLKLVEVVTTNSFSAWKAKATELKSRVDAFFVVNHSTLKDDQGASVDSMKVAAWYLANIKKPEATAEKQFVEEGMLLTADDSGYKQGYEAGRLANQILHEKKNPGDIPIITPTRGAIMANRQRAATLGIDLTNKTFIEEFIDRSAALEKYPQQ